MTPKQIERIQNKIKKIRKALYDEKRIFGDYHDGRGLRYAPLGLYLKISDYKGGMTYLRWFKKIFPDDIGTPDFLFEWTIILFKNGKIKEAEAKAIHAFLDAPFLFDKFFGRPIKGNDINPDWVDLVFYSKNQTDLVDFADWLAAFEKSERFQESVSEYERIEQKLSTENDTKKRGELTSALYKIKGFE